MSDKMFEIFDDLLNWRCEVVGTVNTIQYLMDFGVSDYELRNDYGFGDDDIEKAHLED